MGAEARPCEVTALEDRIVTLLLSPSDRSRRCGARSTVVTFSYPHASRRFEADWLRSSVWHRRGPAVEADQPSPEPVGPTTVTDRTAPESVRPTTVTDRTAPEPVRPTTVTDRTAPEPVEPGATTTSPGVDAMPPPVCTAFALLRHAAVPDPPPDATPAATPAAIKSHGARSLAVIEAAEVVKAWADSIAVEATLRLHRMIHAELLDGPDAADLSPARRQLLSVDARSATASEIEAATGLGLNECFGRVHFALAPRLATCAMRSKLRQGCTSYHRVRTVWEKAGELPADLVDQIARSALAPRRDGSPRSQAQFRRDLHRLFQRHQSPKSVAEQQAETLKGRGAFGELEPDGTGSLQITGSGARAAAAITRVDRLARRFRARGDSRTLPQLRSDVALDLLLYGWTPPVSTAPEPHSGSSARDPMAAYRRLGASPPATVDVVITLPTLLGLDDGVAEVRGHGFVGADLAREIALARGSVWSRIVTDPLTGRAVERSLERYQPDAAMRTQAETRDHLCRGPGCTVPATQCQLDHEEPWDATGAGGPTSEPNLLSKHPRHHSLKTKGYWTSEVQDDGTLEWTTLAGRTYLTHPHDYRELDGSSGGRRCHDEPQDARTVTVAGSGPMPEDLIASRRLYDQEAAIDRHSSGIDDEGLPLFVQRRPAHHRHARTPDPEPPSMDPDPPPF